MASQLGKVPTKTSKDCFFKGSGRAVLNVYGFQEWKYFFDCNERGITEPVADLIESKADFENFTVEGTITVEWPDVTLTFNMDKFLGKCRMDTLLVSP